mmetsp:Transcript_12606/g.26823  ORF Transcript_12606/g.26823 Transcript_12606/m.26823 type:complete len:171 (+) Transcript_12606:335-847(+)
MANETHEANSGDEDDGEHGQMPPRTGMVPPVASALRKIAMDEKGKPGRHPPTNKGSKISEDSDDTTTATVDMTALLHDVSEDKTDEDEDEATSRGEKCTPANAGDAFSSVETEQAARRDGSSNHDGILASQTKTNNTNTQSQLHHASLGKNKATAQQRRVQPTDGSTQKN